MFTATVLPLGLGAFLSMGGMPVAGMPAPELPSFTYLASINQTLGEQLFVGPGPSGTQVIIPTIGGTVHGPKVSGKLLAVGGDWVLVDANGTSHSDSRILLQTDDGANIYIQGLGVRQPNQAGWDKPIFTTGSDRYYWLNDIVTISRGVLVDGVVTTHLWYPSEME